jgi:hypothetical protein
MPPKKPSTDKHRQQRVTPVEPKTKKRDDGPPRPNLEVGDLVEVVMMQKSVFFDVPKPTKVVSLKRLDWTVPWWSVEVEAAGGTRSFDSSLIRKLKP